MIIILIVNVTIKAIVKNVDDWLSDVCPSLENRCLDHGLKPPCPAFHSSFLLLVLLFITFSNSNHPPLVLYLQISCQSFSRLKRFFEVSFTSQNLLMLKYVRTSCHKMNFDFTAVFDKLFTWESCILVLCPTESPFAQGNFTQNCRFDKYWTTSYIHSVLIVEM